MLYFVIKIRKLRKNLIIFKNLYCKNFSFVQQYQHKNTYFMCAKYTKTDSGAILPCFILAFKIKKDFHRL